MAKDTEEKNGQISDEEKELRELEENYSLYNDWTPAIRAVAWGAVIIFIVIVYITMNSDLFHE